MNQDKLFWTTFSVILAILILIAVAVFITAQIAGGGGSEERGPMVERFIQQRIQPVGQVYVGEPPSAEELAQAKAEQESANTVSVEQVVQGSCNSCHGTGAMGAPVVGQQGDWAPRAEQGFDTLVSHAINGFKAMPPKGGNPALSDDVVREAVAYMLKESGLDAPDVGGGESQEAAEPAPQQQQAAAPAQPAQQEQPAQQADAGGAVAQGEEVYQTACAACHAAGVMGAPKVGDAAGWGPRLEKGQETLVQNAITGIGAMPPKGGRTDLSDEQVAAAVEFMLEQTQ